MSDSAPQTLSRRPPDPKYWFKPGKSGNPKGRLPDNERFEAIANRILREKHLAPPEFQLAPKTKMRREEIILRKLVLAAEAGDAEAARILLDRKWEKRTKIELEVPVDALLDAEAVLERRIAKAIGVRRAPPTLQLTNGHDVDDGESP